VVDCADEFGVGFFVDEFCGFVGVEVVGSDQGCNWRRNVSQLVGLFWCVVVKDDLCGNVGEFVGV
jgi:hypothetical protein